jgi:hypothetical protein
VKEALVIIGIALGVCGGSVVGWFICVKMDGRKLRKKLHERRVEDAEREEMFGIHAVKRLGDFSVYVPEKKEPVGFIQAQHYDDDSTVTLPVIEEP